MNRSLHERMSPSLLALDQASEVRNEVLDEGYCIGCGACAYLAPEKYRIGFDEFGMLKAQVHGKAAGDEKKISQVCPFSNYTMNEDALAAEIFAEVEQQHRYVGRYLQCYVGHVEEGEFRRLGSSGGLGKWVLHELLVNGSVDYVIQVAGNGEGNPAFEYKIFSEAADVLKGAKSAYYPVTLEQSLNFIRENPGRYAVTAVPCFAKALRNLMKVDETIKSRVSYIIGIICGHLKSTAFAESFAWQLGIEPQELGAIEFREKIPGKMANDKGIIATDRRGKNSDIRSSKELLGGNWGHNLFKYKACDFCDDVIAETADLAIGDAWLPEHMSDHKGGSVVVARHKELFQLIEKAISSKRVALERVEPDIVVKSQLGGIRHRNEGLALRLHDAAKNKQWAPLKRVKASSRIPRLRRTIYRTRVELRDLSHSAFLEAKKRKDFDYFRKAISPLIAAMDHKPFYYRAARYVYRALKNSVQAV